MPGSARTDEPDDESLMLAYAGGDAAAFDRLYHRHKGGVYRYLVRQCKSAAIADELFQDIWMSVIRVRASWQTHRALLDVALHARPQPARRPLARERPRDARVHRRRR
jgi:hypothetical protein